jgi:hypothetical protein
VTIARRRIGCSIATMTITVSISMSIATVQARVAIYRMIRSSNFAIVTLQLIMSFLYRSSVIVRVGLCVEGRAYAAHTMAVTWVFAVAISVAPRVAMPMSCT